MRDDGESCRCIQFRRVPNSLLRGSPSAWCPQAHPSMEPQLCAVTDGLQGCSALLGCRSGEMRPIRRIRTRTTQHPRRRCTTSDMHQVAQKPTVVKRTSRGVNGRDSFNVGPSGRASCSATQRRASTGARAGAVDTRAAGWCGAGRERPHRVAREERWKRRRRDSPAPE